MRGIAVFFKRRTNLLAAFFISIVLSRFGKISGLIYLACAGGDVFCGGSIVFS